VDGQIQPASLTPMLDVFMIANNLKSCFLIGIVCCVWTLSAIGAEPSEKLKIITHNVWYGFTKQPDPRHEHWRQWMNHQAPDVVALQELNGYTADELAADAKSWGHDYFVLLKTDGFPTGITSRYPVTDVKRIREGMHHGLMRCRIRDIWFYVIHFHPSDFSRRIEEAGHLQADIQSLPEQNPRIVLAGDFNGFSPADRAKYDADPQLVEFFEMLDRRDKGNNLNAGRLDYGGMEAILAQGFVDTVALRRPNDAPFVGTFPSNLVREENHGTDRRLDFIFISPNLVDSLTEAKVLRNSETELLSDHLPVTATLKVTPPAVVTGSPILPQDKGAGE
jgi:endonuclease/exonuclease/phosphatase family metal-dependent hydrolase